MASLREILKKRRERRQQERASRQQSLGDVLLTPKEATPERIERITQSGATATVVTGTLKDPRTESFTRSGGSVVRTTSPQATQLEFQREQARIAEEQRRRELQEIQNKERLRQSDLRKIEEIKRQRQIEAQKIKEAERRAEIEREQRTTRDIKTGITKLEREKQRGGLFIPKTDRFGRSEAFYVQTQAQQEINQFANKTLKEVQGQVNSGKLSVSEANKILNNKIDKKVNEVNKRLEKKYPILSKEDLKIDKKNIYVPGKTRLQKGIEKLFNLSANERLKAEQAGLKVTQLKKELEKTIELEKQGRVPLGTSKELAKQYRNFVGKSIGRKALSTLTNSALGFALLSQIPSLLKTSAGRTQLATEVKALPKNIKNDLAKFGRLYKSNPEQAAISALINYFELRTGTKLASKLGGTTSNVVNRIKNVNPFLLRAERGLIRVRKGLPSGKELVIKTGTIADIKEPLARQLRREGKNVIAVSAQANRLVSAINRKAIIRKPFPFDEKKLTPRARQLLKKFDKGKTTPNEVLTLNRLLREETKRLGVQAKGIDLLERSTYFDPDRTLRASRLGFKTPPAEEGTFFDLLTGRASLFSSKLKPQILVVEDLVEQLPRTKEFQSIIRKIKSNLKAGKDINLTKNELALLSRWQVNPSGKLKPIGSTTYQGGLERELTIAPGEAIKRVRKLGTLLYEGKRIPIVAVRIIKDKSKIKVLRSFDSIKDKISGLTKKLTKAKNPTIRKRIQKEIIKEENRLSKFKTKIKSKEVKDFIRDSRRFSQPRKKVFPLGKKTLTTGTRLARRLRPTRKGRTTRKLTRAGRTTAKRTTRKTGRTPRKSRGKITTRPTVKRPIVKRPTRAQRPTRPSVRLTKPIKRLTGNRKDRADLGKRSKQGYDVYVKSRGKFYKANTKPLSKKDAENRRAFVVDNSTSVTAYIKPLSKFKQLGKITPKEAGAKNKIKARTFRISRGRKKELLNTIIEKKGSPRINTPGEKRGLSAARLIKQLNKPTQRKVTPQQRKVLLERLKKARAVRMKNLKRTTTIKRKRRS